jgi:hypothetical protein
MLKTKYSNIKPIWLILSGIATIGIGYGVYYWFNKGGQLPTFSSKKSKENGFCKYSGFPLKYGSCGNEVIVLQKYLNSKTKTPRVQLKVDGKFGNSTKESLLRIEKISSVSQAQFAQFKIQLNPFL